MEENETIVYGAVKAVGEWTLDVLGIPFGGPIGGKDRDGEYFSPATNIHEDKYPLPPVVYYHGMDPDGVPMGDPAFIGKTISMEKRTDGVWYRVILDKANELAQRVWEAAKEGKARASSGSVYHMIRKARDGHILHWAVNELSLLDAGGRRQPINNYAVAIPALKALYEQAGIELPEISDPEANSGAGGSLAEAGSDDGEGDTNNLSKQIIERNVLMDEKEKQALEAAAKAAGRAEVEAEITAAKARADELEAAKADAVKAYQEQAEADAKAAEELAAKSRRLPDNVTIAKNSDLWKYDNLTPEDQAVMVGVLQSAKQGGTSRNGASNSALKALAVKLNEDKSRVGEMGRQAMKAAGMKADEIQQQDLTSYGDEWVGVAYSQALWEAIRAGTFVAANMPSIEVPAGHESITIPLESGDPTFYKVAEATATQTSGWPNTTITSSQMGTAKKSLTLAKMGARVLWSGELEEDSLIPFVAQLRAQLEKAGAEQLEHAIVDGDTATAASTNINDIGNTAAQGGTELHLLFNGFRKSALVTTTANSRSGGALTPEDFLETLKLMGAAGVNAYDMTKVAFIVDPNVYWKALELPEVKTRDVFAIPTIENGVLTGIYGYKLHRSHFMHFKSAVRKANTSGKVDQTTVGNNTTGSILAVRWDQWLMGYRRRMTMETTRIARADVTEIVALARLGLAQRDTEASAITYGLTV